MGKKHVMLPDDVQALLRMAQAEVDPVRKEQVLLHAADIAPDDLSVQKELLYLGDLPRRDPKKIDYSVIKCYLLHVFEHPEQHAEEAQRQMTRDIFDHPQLQKCLSLAQDKPAFMQEYLHTLCREYLHIFIEGQREHAGGWLGFQLPGRRVKGLSMPCADMVRGMLLSPFMTEEECTLLVGVFYRECLSFLGDVKYLDDMLGSRIAEMIR